MRHSVFLVTMILALAACDDSGTFSSFSNNFGASRDTSNREYYKSDDPLVVGQVLFRDEAYGRAYTRFKRALDHSPEDPAALLGFAASADMLGRFDQSNPAYEKLSKIIGNRIEYQNNRGYSLLLQGDLINARAHFIRAYEMDPSNERAANNLELLRNSVNYPKRSAGDLRPL